MKFGFKFDHSKLEGPQSSHIAKSHLARGVACEPEPEVWVAI